MNRLSFTTNIESFEDVCADARETADSYDESNLFDGETDWQFKPDPRTLRIEGGPEVGGFNSLTDAAAPPDPADPVDIPNGRSLRKRVGSLLAVAAMGIFVTKEPAKDTKITIVDLGDCPDK